jgi:hypothetical protein
MIISVSSWVMVSGVRLSNSAMRAAVSIMLVMVGLSSGVAGGALVSPPPIDNRIAQDGSQCSCENLASILRGWVLD